MELVRDVVIDRHIDEVFDFVADPLHDPAWRPTVVSVVQVVEADGLGARYDVLHRPVRFRPPRRTLQTCVLWEPPARVGWHGEDAAGGFDVTCELESVWTATRVTRRTVAPRRLRWLAARDDARELRALKRILERY